MTDRCWHPLAEAGGSLGQVTQAPPSAADAEQVPSSRLHRIAWLAVLALAVAAGLSLLALRPVFASASASAAVEPASAPAPGSPGILEQARLAPVTQGDALASPAAAEPVTASTPATGPDTDTPNESLIARVTGGTVQLHAGPGKEVVAEVGTTSEFGSPLTVGVVERQGDWLGVVTPELPNGQVGWINLAAGGVELSTTQLLISIDLSRRELVLKKGDETLRRVTVGVGQPGSPTPTGRFAVTDELAGADFSPVYGCCIIALSAHQPNPPPGWEGGDRIAIHGTSDPATIGAATSAGCPHAADEDLRFLIERVPLGTPVVIHP